MIVVDGGDGVCVCLYYKHDDMVKCLDKSEFSLKILLNSNFFFSVSENCKMQKLR